MRKRHGCPPKLQQQEGGVCPASSDSCSLPPLPNPSVHPQQLDLAFAMVHASTLLEGDVIIGGQDVSSQLQACDAEFRSCIIPTRQYDWAVALYLILMRNKLDRFARSARMATSPNARFPMTMGDSDSLEKTMSDLDELEGDLARIRRSGAHKAQPLRSNSGDGDAPGGDPGFFAALQEAIAPIESLDVESSQFQRVGLPEESARRYPGSRLHRLLQRANYGVTTIYERFPQTYGPQRILAASEAAQVVAVTGGSQDTEEARVVCVMLSDVDMYLARAVQGRYKDERRRMSPLAQELHQDRIASLSSADFERRKKTGFGPYFFDDDKGDDDDYDQERVEDGRAQGGAA